MPGLGDDAPQSRLLLALHRFVTGTLAALAAALGVAVQYAEGRGCPSRPAGCRLPATALGACLVVTTVLTHSTRPGNLPRVFMAALPPLARCIVLGLINGPTDAR
ncbi:hypothetical protein ACH4TQ_50675 [Streptomyces sp. NPDC021218]|uniref:hypothetical protein n=1 Tax=unclassified Streptomyces TaxID=2593676 RepID=UPI0036A790EA